MVWAIGEARLHNYLLPRDCPRVTFYAGASTTAADSGRFLRDAANVVAIEQTWVERCRRTTLFVYELDSTAFELEDAVAHYHTSPRAVIPIDVRRIDGPLAALRARGVELRVLPSLWDLHDKVAASTLAFSIIRMRNAAPRLPG